MSLLAKFEKSRNTANLVSDGAKNQVKYLDNIQKVESFNLSQVESPANATYLAPRPGGSSYVDAVFEETVS